jgi:hypothetical protein
MSAWRDEEFWQHVGYGALALAVALVVLWLVVLVDDSRRQCRQRGGVPGPLYGECAAPLERR